MSIIVCPQCGKELPKDSSFCQYCGSVISRQDKKIWKTISFILIAIILFMIVGIVYGFKMYTEEEDYAKQKEADYLELSKEYNALSNDYAVLENKFNDAMQAKNVLEEFVVFVGKDETYYHKWNCSKFDNSYFFAFNVNYAEDQGYIPCPYCE